MHITAIIPARYHSTRLPAKLMRILEGKTILRRTYEEVCDTNLFSKVLVACDHEDLEKEMLRIGADVVVSQRYHESGTDRIAEAAEKIETDIVVNIQGDEPFITKESLSSLLQLFENPKVEIATLMMPLTDKEKWQNPNCVKVVVDKDNKALYFSRAAIPYLREGTEMPLVYQHIGVYAFRKQALQQFTSLPVSTLERIEKLENLRALENGMSIHCAIISQVGISIDTEEDFKAAENYLASLNKSIT